MGCLDRLGMIGVVIATLLGFFLLAVPGSVEPPSIDVMPTMAGPSDSSSDQAQAETMPEVIIVTAVMMEPPTAQPTAMDEIMAVTEVFTQEAVLLPTERPAFTITPMPSATVLAASTVAPATATASATFTPSATSTASPTATFTPSATSTASPTVIPPTPTAIELPDDRPGLVFPPFGGIVVQSVPRFEVIPAPGTALSWVTVFDADGEIAGEYCVGEGCPSRFEPALPDGNYIWTASDCRPFGCGLSMEPWPFIVDTSGTVEVTPTTAP